MDKTTQLLVEGLNKLLFKGWAKGSWQGANETSCALGALGYQSASWTVHGQPITPEMRAATKRLAKFLPDRGDDLSTVTYFNDKNMTTQQDVIDLYVKAINSD